jgi:hypothetical protein
MNTRELAAFIRMMNGDAQQLNISADMIVYAVNYAARELYDALALAFSSVTQKRATIPITDGEGELPADYGTLVRVEDGSGNELFKGGSWDLEGDTVLSDLDEVTVVYNRSPVAIASLGDTLDVPGIFFNDVADIASAILKGDRTAAHGHAVRAAKRAAERRTYARIPNRSAWQ